MAVELISVSAYARRRGCDEKAVRKAIADGRITAIERDGRKLIDPEVADIQWAKNTRARADSQRAAPGTGEAVAAPETGYNAHRNRREAAEALRAELQARRLAGELVERAQVDVAVFDVFRALRDRMPGVARAITAAVLGLTDAREVEAAVTAELRKAFEAFEQHDAEILRAELAR